MTQFDNIKTEVLIPTYTYREANTIEELAEYIINNYRSYCHWCIYDGVPCNEIEDCRIGVIKYLESETK